MPDTGTIVWGATCGLIVIMLAMIRYTVSKGIENILEQLKELWKKMDSNEKENSTLRIQFEALKARCDERRALRRNTDGNSEI